MSAASAPGYSLGASPAQARLLGERLEAVANAPLWDVAMMVVAAKALGNGPACGVATAGLEDA